MLMMRFLAIFMLQIITIILPIFANLKENDDNWIPSRDECPTWDGLQEVECHPILIPKPKFDPSKEADELDRIIRSKNYKELKNILVKTFDERLAIRKKYEDKYKKDLYKLFQEELAGHFRQTILALIKPMSNFYCDEINYALSLPDGMFIKSKAKLNSLLEIIGCLSTKGLENLDLAFGFELCKMMELHMGHTEARFDIVLCHMLRRPENMNVSGTAILADLQEILISKKRKDFTETFSRIICKRSNAHIRHLLLSYEGKTGKVFTKDKDKLYRKFNLASTSLKYNSLLDFCDIVLNRSLYLARHLYDSLKHLKTFHAYDIIRRILIGRAEIDLGNILIAFAKKYKMSLADHIRAKITNKSQTEYRDLLLKIIKKSHMLGNGP